MKKLKKYILCLIQYRKLFAIRDPESLDSIPGQSCFNKIFVILFLFLPVLSWYTESHHGIQINSLCWNYLKVIKNQIITSIMASVSFLSKCCFCMWRSPLDLQTKVALQCLHVLYFSLVVFYDHLFSDIFLCVVYTILNCFFSRSLCRAEKYIHLKLLMYI